MDGRSPEPEPDSEEPDPEAPEPDRPGEPVAPSPGDVDEPPVDPVPSSSRTPREPPRPSSATASTSSSLPEVFPTRSTAARSSSVNVAFGAPGAVVTEDPERGVAPAGGEPRPGTRPPSPGISKAEMFVSFNPVAPALITFSPRLRVVGTSCASAAGLPVPTPIAAEP